MVVLGVLLFILVTYVFLGVILRKAFVRNKLLVHYSDIFKNTDACIEYYGADGLLKDINQASFDLLDFKGEKNDIIGKINIFSNPVFLKNIFSENPNRDISIYLADIEKLKGEKLLLEYDLREENKDNFFQLCKVNKILCLELRFNVIRDKNSCLKAILCTYTDVTDIITAKKTFEDEKIKAQNSDRLKSKFLANMSHEIRTPLNAIVGFSDLLASDEFLDEREGFNRLIQDNSQQLLTLINDILDLSKLDAGVANFNYSDFDLVELLNGLKLSLSSSFNKDKIEFILNIQDPKLMIHSDKQKFTQIISNYLTNSFKYTEKGIVSLSYKIQDSFIEVQVSDTGIGISEDKKDKVFVRFEKLDNFAKGTGLGLSICKTLAENMGGNVGFESTEGVGSNFWVKLPIK